MIWSYFLVFDEIFQGHLDFQYGKVAIYTE